MTPRKKSAPAPAPTPTITGEVWEQQSWLPSPGPELPGWFAALKQAHEQAVAEWHRSVQLVVDLQAEIEATERQWRRTLRDTIAVGDPAPERPFDPSVQRAKLEVAQEDAADEREKLAEACVTILGRLRQADDGEIAPVLQHSRELAVAIGYGPHGSLVEAAKADLRRRMRELTEKSGPSLVDISDPSQKAYYEDEEAENVVA